MSKIDATLAVINEALTESIAVQSHAVTLLHPEMPVNPGALLEMAREGARAR